MYKAIIYSKLTTEFQVTAPPTSPKGEACKEGISPPPGFVALPHSLCGGIREASWLCSKPPPWGGWRGRKPI
jgi:hypothetical protein